MRLYRTGRKAFTRTVFSLALAALVAGPAMAQDGEKVLKVGGGSEINSLDPHTVQDIARFTVKTNTYDPLFRYIGNPPQMEPWLATGHKVTPDGLVYTIDLVQGAKFHDGTEVTADDVVYSMDRMLELKQGPARFFSALMGPGDSKAIGKYQVQFTLKTPAAPFVGLLSELWIANKALVQANEKNGDRGTEWLSRNTAGSGPYHVTEYNPAVGWYAERFKDHFKGWSGIGYPDGIRFRTIREINSQSLALTRGDLDIFLATMQQDQVARLAKVPTLVTLQEPHMRLFIINMNNLKPPFDDIHIRRAIAYSFDYEGFIQGVMGGKAKRNPAPLPETMWGYPKGVTGISYDLEKAKAELAKAKVKIDRPLSIHAMTGFAQPEQAAQFLQAGLRKIGIQANIVAETWPTLSEKCRKADTAPEIMPIWASASYADPHGFVGEMYDSTRWGSYATCSFYKNAGVDEMLKKAYVSTDQAEREKLYAEAAKIVTDEAPSLFIYNEEYINVRNKRVLDYQFTPIGQGHFLKSVRLQ